MAENQTKVQNDVTDKALEDADDVNTEKQPARPYVRDSGIPKDWGWAWMVMLGCCLVHVFIIGGAIKSFGVLYVEFMERFETTAEAAAWILVFTQGATLYLAPLANFLALKLSNRFIVFVGGLLIALGFMLSMNATSIIYLYFSYGGLVGLGAAFAWSPSIAAMAHYFTKRRALANGIAVGGAGVGNLLLPQFMRFCLDTYGYKGSLLILSALMLHVCVSAFLLRPPQFYTSRGNTNCREMKEIDKSSQEDAKIVEPSAKSCTNTCRINFCCPGSSTSSKVVMFEWKLLKNLLFLLYGVSSFFFFCGFPGLFIIIAPHAKAIGYSKKDAAFLLSIMGVADIVGRVGTGWFADFKLIRKSNIVVISQMLTCGATVVLPFVHNYVGIAALCWINGMFTGSFMAIIPVILAESLGVHKVASSLGLIGLFMGAGVFVSPPTVGRLRDVTGSWNVSFYFTGGVLLLSAFTMMFAPLVSRWRRKRNACNQLEN